MKKSSSLGNRISQYLKTGSLVPDDLVNEVVLEHLHACDAQKKGILLDGFPRTLSQAKFLDDNYKEKLTAVNIVLDRDVTVQKLLGRRLCTVCGGSFNVAHIVDAQFDMPAILPDKRTCKMGDACVPNLVCRDDDSPEIIANRLKDFEKNIEPLLAHYRAKNSLKEFTVKKGIKDTDQLFEMMTSIH